MDRKESEKITIQYYSLMRFISTNKIDNRVIKRSRAIYDCENFIKWEKLDKESYDMIETEIENILKYEEIIINASRFFSENVKMFYEYQGSVDVAKFKIGVDTRVNMSVKCCYIENEGSVHTETIIVDDNLTEETLIKRTENFIKQFSYLTILDRNAKLNKNIYTIKFSENASAMIVHEIFGHPFEDDFTNNFIEEKISLPSFLELFNMHRAGMQNLMKIDDSGNMCVNKQTLVKDGKIVDRIKDKRRSRYDGLSMTRMTFIDLVSTKDFSEEIVPYELKIIDMIGGAVDVVASKVYLFPQTILNHTGTTKYDCDDIVLEINVSNLKDNLLWVGKEKTIYASVCVKMNSPITVFTRTPQLILKNVEIKDRTSVFL